MELIEKILSEENINEAIKQVKSNKGAPGVDKMTVNEIGEYFKVHKEEIKNSIMAIIDLAITQADLQTGST